MATVRPLSLAVATLYAELHDLSLLDIEAGRAVGGFVAKTVKGRRYWYKQYRLGGNVRVQKAVGAETPDLLATIETWKREHAERLQQKKIRQELCRAIKAALRMTVDPLSARIIAALAERGAFENGAVLIGTHAYVAYASMLGHALSQLHMQTRDIDVAVVDIAADATTIVPDIVAALDKAFFQVPPRPGSSISTKLQHRATQARIELLTPHRRGEAWTPISAPRRDFGAQQVPYLDYLLEGPAEATYLYDGGVRVRVPHPARFALHKLIVAASRDVAMQTKSVKDAAQAAELIAILSEERPDDLREAGEALAAHGGAYLGKARSGAARLAAEIRCRLPLELQG